MMQTSKILQEMGRGHKRQAWSITYRIEGKIVSEDRKYILYFYIFISFFLMSKIHSCAYFFILFIIIFIYLLYFIIYFV